MTTAQQGHPFDLSLFVAGISAQNAQADQSSQPEPHSRWLQGPDQGEGGPTAGREGQPRPIVAMSKVAVVAWLPLAWLFPHPLSSAEPGDQQDPVVAAKERTRRTLRLLSQVTADFGQLLPVVGVIGPDEGMDEGMNAAQQGLVAAVRLWPTEQDWHRGEFALYVEKSSDKLKSRCRDVLSPRLPSVGPFKPRSRDDQHMELANSVEPAIEAPGVEQGSRLEAGQLIDQWLSAIKSVKGKNTSSEDTFEAGSRKALRSIEDWLQPDRYLQDLDGGSSPTPTSEDNGPRDDYPQPHSPMLEHKSIGRVHAVNLSRIRGWTGDDATRTSAQPDLFTNAAIVLINAPNGRGKSSLLHAMSLAITGRAPNDEHGSVSYGRAENESGRQRKWPGNIEVYHGVDSDCQPDLLRLALNEGHEEGWKWSNIRGAQTFERPDVLNEAVRGADAHPRPTSAPRKWWPGTSMHRMLQYRLTSYFPEYVRDQFDHVQRRSTLVSHIRPRLEAFIMLKEAARTLIDRGTVELLTEDSRAQAARFDNDRVANLWEVLDISMKPLRESLMTFAKLALPADLERHLAVVTEALKVIHTAKDPGECLQNAKAGLGAPPLPDVAGLVRTVDSQLLDEGQSGALQAGVDEEMDRLQHELLRIRAGIANFAAGHAIDELGAWEALLYAGEPSSAQPDQTPLLLGVVDGIRRLRQVIPSKPPAHPDAHRIYAELSLVRLDHLADLENFARALHDRHQVEMAEIHALRRRESEVLREIDGRKTSAEASERRRELVSLRACLDGWAPAVGTSQSTHHWAAMSSAWKQWSSLAFDALREERRMRYLSHAKWLNTKARDALVRLSGALESTNEADLELATTINDSVQQVLGRFAIAASSTLSNASTVLQEEHADGEVHRYRNISLADGVLHEAEFSTGTRTQVAIAELVGQKLVALSESLPEDLRVPNRVILLDDVSSAYDLTNLVRESLLWRQLAFHPDPKQRLQIFIGTHHETMTNRLYDLLTPPQGCRVIVHQLTDWSIEKGPSVESFELAPCDKPNWADLAATVQEELS